MMFTLRVSVTQVEQVHIRRWCPGRSTREGHRSWPPYQPPTPEGHPEHLSVYLVTSPSSRLERESVNLATDILGAACAYRPGVARNQMARRGTAGKGSQPALAMTGGSSAGPHHPCAELCGMQPW